MKGKKVGAGEEAAEDDRDRQSTAPTTPFSMLLAEKKAQALTRQSASGKAHNWTESSTTQSATNASTVARSSASTSKLTPKQLIRKYKAKVKPKTWLYTLFALVELIMIGTCAISIAASHRAVITNYEGAATDALNGVHEGYTKKVFQMRNLLENTKFNFDVQSYLNDTASAAKQQQVEKLIAHIAVTYRIEYVTLLGADMKILASANKDRAGEPFDPEGIVTAAAHADTVPVWTYARHTMEQLLAEDFPVRWDRESQLDESFKGGSQANYRGDAVVRWAAVAVKAIDKETFEVISPGEAASGFLVLGDLVNGKSSATSLTASTIGGIASIFTRRDDADADPRKRWITGMSSVSMNLKARVDGSSVVQNTLVQGFSPYDAQPDSEASMDAVQLKPDADESAKCYQINPYMTALRKWHKNDEMEPSSGRPGLVLSRGVIIDRALTSGFVTKQWICVGIIVFIDAFTLFLATWMFLAPLEAMGKRIRSGQRIDFGFLKSLTRRKRLGAVIAAAALASLGVGVFIQQSNARNLERLVYTKSAFEPGSTMLAYRQQPDQVSRILATTQVGSGLLGLLANPGDTARLEFAHHRLGQMEDSLWLDMVLLLDSTGKVLVVPEGGTQEGQLFDTANDIVNATIQQGTRFTRSATMPASELAKFNSVRRIDRYFNTTPVSAHDPRVTGEEVLVRWMSCPMWIGGPDSGEPVAGVLLAADIVNGKTRIVERSNKMVGRGWSGIYFYNSTRQYQMAVAVIRIGDDSQFNFEVDVELPATKWLDQLRLSREWITNDQYTVHAQIKWPAKGGRWVFSARCLNKNEVYKDFGADIEDTDWFGQPLGDCLGYLIEGIPWSSVAGSLRASYAWQWIFIITCACKVVAMGVLCYRAYLPFSKIVVNNKFVQGNHHAVDDAPARGGKNLPPATGSRKYTKDITASITEVQ
eukprot:TRINITY_DN4733_c0_g1_i1.p1 TRINITY_DN4733_c0_g1~~TRINITY_DN4733_c0_g1_i1.p1  ORF type:complete len:932 (-),score=372.03 TRINITY_DN4733_c0_g1_i1:455-3250(-)